MARGRTASRWVRRASAVQPGLSTLMSVGATVAPTVSWEFCMHFITGPAGWALPYGPADRDDAAYHGRGDRGEPSLPIAGKRQFASGNDGPRATILLLGGFQVRTPDHGRVEPSGVPADVLKLVAVRRTVHVDEVIGQVWPEVDATTGRRRLRNVLARIRATCGDLVVRSGDLLALADEVEVDAHRFEEDARRALTLGGRTDEAVGLASAAVATYHGELLPGDRFRDWTVGVRERLQRRFVALLDLLADAAASRGDADEALWLLERAIEHEPYDEERYLSAARVLLEAGRRGAAAMMLRRAGAMLDDLGVMPSGRHRELERELRRG